MLKKLHRTVRVHTHAERIAIVAEIRRRQRAEGLSVRDLAPQLGIAPQTFYNWLRRDARLGIVVSPPPAPAKSARRYSADERAALLDEIARRVAGGQSIDKAVTAVDLARTTYRRWQAMGLLPVPFRMVTMEVPSTSAPDTPLALVPLALAARVTEITPPPLTLVAPGGYRIEGLAVDSAAALLRALS